MSLSEFVKHLYGDTEGLEVADWDSAGLQFREFRDHNKDGFIDKDELMVGSLSHGTATLTHTATLGLDPSPGVRSGQGGGGAPHKGG